MIVWGHHKIDLFIQLQLLTTVTTFASEDFTQEEGGSK